MNRREKLQRQFRYQIGRLLHDFPRGRDLEPAADLDEWEKTVAAAPERERELLRELARFADLWRFLSEREQELGEAVVADIAAVHRVPLAERIARLKEINRKLMERIEDAGRGSQLRQ